jgi:HAD superfamily hydrolase (TIGR01662 family)
MTSEDLALIHDEMLKEVRKYGGRIHAIYSATDLVENDTRQMRKPGAGMAKQAKKDFPEIDFSKTIIVGDSVSDMQFGRNLGMVTVFAGDRAKLGKLNEHLADEYCDSLGDFAGMVVGDGN